MVLPFIAEDPKPIFNAKSLREEELPFTAAQPGVRQHELFCEENPDPTSRYVCQYGCGMDYSRPDSRKTHETQRCKLNPAATTDGQAAEFDDGFVDDNLFIVSEDSCMDKNPSESSDDNFIDNHLVNSPGYGNMSPDDNVIDDNLSNSSDDDNNPFNSSGKSDKYPVTRKRKRTKECPTPTHQSYKCDLCWKYFECQVEFDRHRASRQTLCRPYLGRTLNPLESQISFTEWYNITILAPIGTVQNDTADVSMVEVSGIHVYTHVLSDSFIRLRKSWTVQDFLT